MMLNILKVLHASFGLATFGVGLFLLPRLVAGRRFEKPAVTFLKCSLMASAIGLVLAIFHPGPARWTAVLALYVSALAVFALRKLHVARMWVPGFALSVLAVFCLDVFVGIAYLSQFLQTIGKISASRADDLFIAAQAMAALLFIVLGFFSVKHIWHLTTGTSFGPKVTG